MIILYAIPENDSRAARLRDILSEEGIARRYVGTDAAGHTLGELFAGDDTPKPHAAADLPKIQASFSTLPTSTTTPLQNSSTNSSITASFSAIRCLPTRA